MEQTSAQAAIRFGYGPGQDTAPGPSPADWLKAQLQGPDPGLAGGVFDSLPTGQTAVDMMQADFKARHALLTAPDAQRAAFRAQSVALVQAEAAAQIGWAVASPSGFRERLVWFWANHFSTSYQQNGCGPLIGAMLREAIRPHVTGNFTDMVLAVERHPAMLRYLDNAVSVGPGSPVGQRLHRGLNENLGRECMELHTVGLTAGYTQTDVTNMAKLLTGWSIAGVQGGSDSTGFKYRPAAHEPGPQTLLGQRFSGGEQAGVDALRFLASYPTTYQLIATKLVRHFVGDTPPPGDVARIAGVLRDTGGDLGAASAALVDLPAAWVPGTKLKSPFDYVVSTLRAAPLAAGETPVDPQMPMAELGQPLWGAPLPNGWPDIASAWDNGAAMLARVGWAYGYAGRLDYGPAGAQPADIAQVALGGLLRPATATALAAAGSRREAMTLILTAPEFQRR